MNSTLGRAVGVVVGLIIVIAGIWLLRLDAGQPQSGPAHALLSVLTALGIGVIGASLLPNSMTLDGKEVKPLGIGLNASGGAAFFIVTLVFLFYSADKKSEAQPNTPVEQTEIEKPKSNSVNDEAEKPVAPPEVESVQVPTPEPVKKIFYRYRTYCDSCCNGTPKEICSNSGSGQSYDEDEAVFMAIRNCVANYGSEERCRANVERY